MDRLIAWIAVATLLFVAFAGTASAQPKHLEPGSLLIFPLFDSAPGAGTVICVTNTSTDTKYCPAWDIQQGEVLLHYVYIDGETWREFDRYELLTPGDTLCVIADQHNTEFRQGFLVVKAVDGSTSSEPQNRKFEYLIGSTIVVQSDLNLLWQYTPYSFRNYFATAIAAQGCTLAYTDGDNDEAPDFDGSEYSYFPRELFIDSFFEENATFTNHLALMSMAGGYYTNEVEFLFWNNVEQKFSRAFDFTCWWMGPLSDISQIVEGLGGDESELGAPPVQTGWASIRGSRIVDGAGNPVPNIDSDAAVPPILGVFGQMITSTDFAAGHALHYRGTIDGLDFKGDADPQAADTWVP